MSRLYPKSKVEVQGLEARFYDQIMNGMSLGLYPRFIRAAVEQMNIQAGDRILDLGCGTGRNSLLMHRHVGNEGEVTGMDISPIMEKQFRKNTRGLPNVHFVHQRIDVPFTLEHGIDKAVMSFVIHGLPHETRLQVIDNIHRNLNPASSLVFLDFAEFSLSDMPIFHRIPFRAIECTYAFDFIQCDWKSILQGRGFSGFEEHFWFKKYVRLLRAVKE
jgi:ubiquinone/menaquinone biosynthesis C-methylase UbiE